MYLAVRSNLKKAPDKEHRNIILSVSGFNQVVSDLKKAPDKEHRNAGYLGA